MKRDYEGRWCDGIAVEPLWGQEEVVGICPLHTSDIWLDIDMPVPEVNPNTTDRQLGLIREALDNPNASLDPNYELYREGLDALERLRDLKPRDIFAFRETWTDADTNLLLELDREPSAWIPKGHRLTAVAFAQRLP